MRRDETYDKKTSREGRRRLSILRLVNKPFCQSASIRLFRCIRATISRSVRENRWPLTRLLAICNSPYASLVRRLQIGYNFFDHPDAREWEPGSRYHLYAEDSARVLPMCLSRLFRLEVLDVFGPTFPSINAAVEYQMRMFTDAVVSVLRYVRLPCLAELNLRLAVTREFGEFFYQYPTASRIPINDVMQQLRHLEIAVSDFTERDSRRNRHASLSALRETYPNADFLSSPLRLIELAACLESLAICGSDLLNMDSLQIGSEICLKYLGLSRVTISIDTIMHILEQCRYSLRGVHFFWVELNSGTWEEVLNKLSTFSQLSYVHISASGYSPTEANRHLLLEQPPIPVGPEEIYTANDPDHRALGNLQRHVIAVRGKAGMLPYREGDVNIRRAALDSQEPEIPAASADNIP